MVPVSSVVSSLPTAMRQGVRVMRNRLNPRPAMAISVTTATKRPVADAAGAGAAWSLTH